MGHFRFRATMCLGVVAIGILGGCQFNGAAGSPDANTLADAAPEPDTIRNPVDSDGDGITDENDNCVTQVNGDQYDEDLDGIGDVCDNCPHLANSDQLNKMEANAGKPPDQVGDRCDPNPAEPGDIIAFFLGFNAPSDISTWSFNDSQGFSVASGQLRTQANGGDEEVAWVDLNLPNATFVTRVTFQNLVANQQHGAALLGRFASDNNGQHGLGCGEAQLDNLNSGNPFLLTTLWEKNSKDYRPHGDGALNEDYTATYSLVIKDTVKDDDTRSKITCNRLENNTEWIRDPAPMQQGHGVALTAWGTTASFDYIVAFDRK